MSLVGECLCGSTRWEMDGDPGPVTVCNCTLCRRAGALWAYDFENERIRIFGPTQSFRRIGKADPALEVVFCPTCANVLAWRGLRPEPDGRRRMAVNVRLCEPQAVADLPIDLFDGFDSFEDFPPDGRRVRDFFF